MPEVARTIGILRKASFPILPLSECRGEYPGSDALPPRGEFVCAGGRTEGENPWEQQGDGKEEEKCYVRFHYEPKYH